MSSLDSSTPNLYKVLQDNQSCHGGDFEWSLPTKNTDGTDTPGEWHEVQGNLILCRNGLHLTSQPQSWYVSGATLYRAEYDGEIIGDPGSDKVAVRRCRLIAEADWAEHGVYLSGHHVVWGNATVEAGGNATVEAGGNATVQAGDNATVRAGDNATVISTTWHSDSAQVALSQMAAHVDRRGHLLVCRTAEAAS